MKKVLRVTKVDKTFKTNISALYYISTLNHEMFLMPSNKFTIEDLVVIINDSLYEITDVFSRRLGDKDLTSYLVLNENLYSYESILDKINENGEFVIAIDI